MKSIISAYIDIQIIFLGFETSNFDLTIQYLSHISYFITLVWIAITHMKIL